MVVIKIFKLLKIDPITKKNIPNIVKSNEQSGLQGLLDSGGYNVHPSLDPPKIKKTNKINTKPNKTKNIPTILKTLLLKSLISNNPGSRQK